jgi:hypothetical protein
VPVSEQQSHSVSSCTTVQRDCELFVLISAQYYVADNKFPLPSLVINPFIRIRKNCHFSTCSVQSAYNQVAFSLCFSLHLFNLLGFSAINPNLHRALAAA